jgi:hypothetical protein
MVADTLQLTLAGAGAAQVNSIVLHFAVNTVQHLLRTGGHGQAVGVGQRVVGRMIKAGECEQGKRPERKSKRMKSGANEHGFTRAQLAENPLNP